MVVSSRRPALILAFVATLLLGGATAALAFEEELAPLEASANERVLRLHDLPPGYVSENDSGCGPLSGEGEPSALRTFILEHRPELCANAYERVFVAPGPGRKPPLVGAAVIAVPEAGAAAQLLDLLISSLKERTGKEAARELTPPLAIGEEARLFRTREIVGGRAHRPATYAIWRQGEFVGILMAAGLAPAQNDRAALALAALQQGRMLAPSEYTEAEKNDVAVPLDDPGVHTPVFWIGQSFRPGRGLPAAELTDVLAIKHRGEGPPGQKISLSYEAFTIGLWNQPGWRAFQRSALGRLNREWRCTRSTRVELDGGYADVFAAYGRDFEVCPNRAPDRYYAIAHFKGAIVGVNLLICTRCLGRGGGPYNSLKGMKAIVRGLTLRPRPVY